MKKLFFVLCFILALDICFAEGRWWEDKFIIGAHWGPPLQYNEDSILTRDFTLLKEGKFNFMLGKLNFHNNQSEEFLEQHLSSLIDECNDSGFLFLNQRGDPDTIYGLNIVDEPSIEEALHYLDLVDSLKQVDSTMLGFINLYPIYNFVKDSSGYRIIDYEAFTSYVNSYLGNDTLQVACFDNYYPNSNFSTNIRPAKIWNYYANLAYMKQAAGSRPLWAYLRSSEKYVEENDTAWQDAYIRLGAFAPLAFGAKGIIYFSYDCKDRNWIRRAPGRGGWKGHEMYFDNDERDRQIFFGNFKYNTNNVLDLAIHTNKDIGTWYIKESRDSCIENDSNPLIKIGTWFGDQASSIPNVYNWDFASDGRDKFTTITRDGRLLLSMFRNGWTHKAIVNVPWSHWSTMSRNTCPFGDFNENHKLDLCLGWTENHQGKLRIYMDCQDNAVQDPSTAITDMSFDNNPQVFTFSDSIKQIFTRNDSIWVITSNPNRSYATSDSLFLLKYNGTQFDTIYPPHKINLSKKIEHYWMEDSLYGQDNDGVIWQEVYGQPYNLTKRRKSYSARSQYVWGQYNNMTHKYDIFSIAPEERYGYQTYALLDRKGRPNRIYQTAKAINKFINDSFKYDNNDIIKSIILDGEWQGAYFSTKPSQSVLNLLKYIKESAENPLPLINLDHSLSERVLFGLFKRTDDNLDLLVINMHETSREIKLSLNKTYGEDSLRCDSITRMYNVVNPQPEVHTHYTKIKLNNVRGGECAILHLTLY